jgi:hypothetical protein
MKEELEQAVGLAAGCVLRLMTTAQVLAACFVLLSQVAGGGGVLCFVCLFLFGGLFVWWCPLRRVMYHLILFLK